MRYEDERKMYYLQIFSFSWLNLNNTSIMTMTNFIIDNIKMSNIKLSSSSTTIVRLTFRRLPWDKPVEIIIRPQCVDSLAKLKDEKCI